MSSPHHDRLPAPRWLLAVTVLLSAIAHVSFAWMVTHVFRPPELDLEFQVPIDVELGLSEAVSMAATPAPPPSPPPPAEPPAVAPDEPGERPHKHRAPSDAGVPHERDAASAHAGDAGAGEDAGTSSDAGQALLAGDAPGSRLPPGAQIAVRVDMTRIRNSPIAEDMRAFVAAIPDWKALLDGSGINPVDQLDRLLIATPNLQREKVVLAGRFVGEASIVDDAVSRLAKAQGVRARWKAEHGVRVAPWANPDVTPRVIALVGPSHFTISREEDLPRLLAIAAARAQSQDRDAGPRDIPADALLSMDENEGLSLEVEGVEQFVRKAKRGIPLKLRLSALEIPGPKVEVRGRMVFADAEKAADGARFWSSVRDAYARNGLVALLGLSQPLQEATVEQRDDEVRLSIVLSVEQTRLILGYVRELLTPPPPVPTAPPPSPAPPTAMPKRIP